MSRDRGQSFLQAAPPGRARPGDDQTKTHEIKTLLRDQKKECAAIKGNTIFKELMRKPGDRLPKAGEGDGGSRRRGGRDDTDAEGKMWMLTTIQDAARRGRKHECGVWSSFGKAYVCMGDFQELKPSLPSLHRDQIEAESEDFKKHRQQMQRRRRQGMSMADNVSVADSKDEGDDASERLWKNLMMVTTKDFREASFPKQPLKMADNRRKQFLSSSSKFVSPREAQVDTSDPNQWGSWYYNKQNQAITPESSATQLSPTRLSQTAGPVTGRMPALNMNSSHSNSAWGGVEQSQELRDNASTPSVIGGSDLPPPPTFDPPLVKFERPSPHDEEGLVEDWRAGFIETRQHMRSRLQKELWKRTQERGQARQNEHMAAGFASFLLSDLEASGGTRGSYHRPGTVPTDIWHQARYFMEHGARKGASRKRPSAGPVDMEEIALLERFYNQLCLLVERQRVSDPCSVALVLSVKALLEKGTTLVRNLLVLVVDCLDKWANTSGMFNHNPCILPILTFIRMCVGLDDDDLQRMVFSKNLGQLVFGAEAETIKALLKPATPKTRSRRETVSQGSQDSWSGSSGVDPRGRTPGASRGVSRANPRGKASKPPSRMGAPSRQ